MYYTEKTIHFNDIITELQQVTLKNRVQKDL